MSDSIFNVQQRIYIVHYLHYLLNLPIIRHILSIYGNKFVGSDVNSLGDLEDGTNYSNNPANKSQEQFCSKAVIYS